MHQVSQAVFIRYCRSQHHRFGNLGDPVLYQYTFLWLNLNEIYNQKYKSCQG